VEIFREAQDGGQDAVFLVPADNADADAIGTVQCKHTSESNRKLRLSDLGEELKTVAELVAQNQADTYVLMTNMSVDAPIARAIRDRLRSLGVRRPHVLGKQFIVRTIRASPKLRAMVPQVYGLGDLSLILDRRLAEQSRVLLEGWQDRLRAYYPTRAHRAAVRALSEHGVVLLLGNPSSGKSAIAAILSTVASDDADHTVIIADSPRDFGGAWNPYDPRRFFWIDDAFGSNVMEDDYIRDWSANFRKVQAAIAKGNRFVFTSRRHIYREAQRRLGERNLGVFASGAAVVDIGALTQEERDQILYNHIKFGRQDEAWKTRVKPFLPAVAAVQEFLPGIAERLGNPDFTKRLALHKAALVRFMNEPRGHLISVINALDDNLRAALMLVYVQTGGFDPGAYDPDAANTVVKLTGIPLPTILNGFEALKGSFLRTAHGARQVWTFAHPTIADALTEILRGQPHMMEVLLQGAPLPVILRTFVCEGAAQIQDALVAPPSLNSLLIDRLTRAEDESSINSSLYWFLAIRATDAVLSGTVAANPDILCRPYWGWANDLVTLNPRLITMARAHGLSPLRSDLREAGADILERAARVDFDLSFFEDERMLSLLPPLRLVALTMELIGDNLPTLEDRIGEIGLGADLDEEPESHFTVIERTLDVLEPMITNGGAQAFIDAARRQIAEEVGVLERRREERDEERAAFAEDWTVADTVSATAELEEEAPPSAKPRSVFDDVDKAGEREPET
jgi:hypothetical protein